MKLKLHGTQTETKCSQWICYIHYYIGGRWVRRPSPPPPPLLEESFFTLHTEGYKNGIGGAKSLSGDLSAPNPSFIY